MLTTGVCDLLQKNESDPLEVVELVRVFDDFSADNDPHGEHDFGAFDLCGQRCFWKIDLYNPALDGFSENPTNPASTFRVLTVMLVAEY